MDVRRLVAARGRMQCAPTVFAMCLLRACQPLMRNGEPESRAFANCTVHTNLTAMSFNDRFANSQTESAAAFFPGVCPFDLFEAIEHMQDSGRRYTAAFIDYANIDGLFIFS